MARDTGKFRGTPLEPRVMPRCQGPVMTAGSCDDARAAPHAMAMMGACGRDVLVHHLPQGHGHAAAWNLRAAGLQMYAGYRLRQPLTGRGLDWVEGVPPPRLPPGADAG